MKQIVVDNISTTYYITKDGRCYNSRTNKFLKGQINCRNHYKTYIITLPDGSKKRLYAHRLVATAFIPNPDNKPEINHIDKNVKNDYYENLEWCDRKYNVNYSKSKKVKSIDDEGNETFYNSIYETRLFGFNYGNVYRCCKNGQKHKKLRWEYVK